MGVELNLAEESPFFSTKSQQVFTNYSNCFASLKLREILDRVIQRGFKQFLQRGCRQRVINAYEAKEGTQRQLAERFQVSQSFVTRLIRRYRHTGKIEPKSRGGGTKAKIKESQLGQIEQLVEEQPDVLLRELCDRWQQKTGIKVSISTMQRQLQKLKLTTKKSFVCE